MEIILIAHKDDKLTPALCEALHEVARLAVAQLEANPKALQKPHQRQERAHQHPADGRCDIAPHT